MTPPCPPTASGPPDGPAMPCARCGAGTRTEYCSLDDGVWAAAARDGDRFLCLGCVEARLGRRLAPGDFDDAPVNRWPAMSEDERRRSHLLGLPGFALSDADVPPYWSARFLDRLGLAHRYARHLGRATLPARPSGGTRP